MSTSLKINISYKLNVLDTFSFNQNLCAPCSRVKAAAVEPRTPVLSSNGLLTLFTLSYTSSFFSLGGEILSSSGRIELFIYLYWEGGGGRGGERESARTLAAVLSSIYLFFTSTSAVACRSSCQQVSPWQHTSHINIKRSSILLSIYDRFPVKWGYQEVTTWKRRSCCAVGPEHCGVLLILGELVEVVSRQLSCWP